MWVFIGLGNPGAEYARHRHNAGFMAVDAIAQRHGFGPFRARFHALVSEGAIAGEKVLLVKPSTYMNLSGQAAQEAAAFYKTPLDRIVVFHDEIDLAPGKVRVKVGGGSAGHNGIRSLDAHLGKEYRRVRIGVGHPGARELVHSYVLHDFAKADSEWLGPLIAAIADEIGAIVEDRDADFMSRIAAVAPPPKPEAKDKDKDNTSEA